ATPDYGHHPPAIRRPPETPRQYSCPLHNLIENAFPKQQTDSRYNIPASNKTKTPGLPRYPHPSKTSSPSPRQTPPPAASTNRHPLCEAAIPIPPCPSPRATSAPKTPHP